MSELWSDTDELGYQMGDMNGEWEKPPSVSETNRYKRLRRKLKLAERTNTDFPSNLQAEMNVLGRRLFKTIWRGQQDH